MSYPSREMKSCSDTIFSARPQTMHSRKQTCRFGRNFFQYLFFFHGISPFENLFLQAPKVHLVATRNPHHRIGDMPDVKTRHRTASHNSYTLPIRHLQNSLSDDPHYNFHKQNIACFDNLAYYLRHILRVYPARRRKHHRRARSVRQIPHATRRGVEKSSNDS